jgi:NAD(P)-dependent dehydrogenase (short-subunit alcohol dehydrogenase family)
MADALRPEDVGVEEYRERMLSDRANVVPLGRPAVATDIANAAAFLCSSESDYMTGLSISVSGGYGMS